jgi:hypothetical protein
VHDRLYGRFLHFADKSLEYDYSGFVVLAIDRLLVEALQQFYDGVTDGSGESGKLIKKFLEGLRFQPYFNTNDARQAFYKDIRCGLLHQAETKKKWLIRWKQDAMLRKVKDGYIIDVERFHTAMKDSLEDYLKLLCNPQSKTLRENLWTKMDDICDVRAARGATMEILDSSAPDPIA